MDQPAFDQTLWVLNQVMGVAHEDHLLDVLDALGQLSQRVDVKFEVERQPNEWTVRATIRSAAEVAPTATTASTAAKPSSGQIASRSRWAEEVALDRCVSRCRRASTPASACQCRWCGGEFHGADAPIYLDD